MDLAVHETSTNCFACHVLANRFDPFAVRDIFGTLIDKFDDGIFVSGRHSSPFFQRSAAAIFGIWEFSSFDCDSFGWKKR